MCVAICLKLCVCFQDIDTSVCFVPSRQLDNLNFHCFEPTKNICRWAGSRGWVGRRLCLGEVVSSVVASCIFFPNSCHVAHPVQTCVREFFMSTRLRSQISTSWKVPKLLPSAKLFSTSCAFGMMPCWFSCCLQEVRSPGTKLDCSGCCMLQSCRSDA